MERILLNYSNKDDVLSCFRRLTKKCGCDERII